MVTKVYTFSVAAFDTKNGPLTEEEEDARHLAKHKMLGNITFIGTLQYDLAVFTLLDFLWTALLP